MKASTTVGEWDRTSFAHEAFVYSDDVALRERCVPYVTEGLDLGQPVVVVASRPVRDMLMAELGDRLSQLSLLEAAEGPWHGASATMAAYQQTMQPLLEAGGPWRLIGQPVWLTYPGGYRWSRYEAIANVAFADYPSYSVCLHDERELPDVRIEHQLRTHPMVWDDDGLHPSPDYVPPGAYLRSVEPAWDAQPPDARVMVITEPREALAQLRALVGPGADTGRGAEVLLAVYELVTNALRQSVPAEVAHWRWASSEVWQVSDAGPGLHDPLVGYTPPGPDLDSGRGLWIARGIAAELTVRATGPGTAVRLYFEGVLSP